VTYPTITLDPAATRQVLGALRKARFRRRTQDIDWVESLYKAYLTGLAAIALIIAASSVVGDGRLHASELVDVRNHGPAIVGIVLGALMLLGFRSGARGGPLSFEPPDITHVLLAPLDRGSAVRPIAWRQLRGVLAIGLVAGATAGNLARGRLPGNTAAWVTVGVVTGVAISLAVWGSASIASGRRLRPLVATSIGVALVAWSAVDLAANTATSPLTWFGKLTLAPLAGSGAVPLGYIGLAVVLLIPVVALVGLAGVSVEAAQRRAGLVDQLRFALTIQDVRAVVLLYRQLSQHGTRSKPWWPHRALGAKAPHPSSWRAQIRRGLHGLARWPLVRVVRMLALAAVVGACAAGIYAGTTPLVVVGGFAWFIAGLDAVEPLAQEADHPDRGAEFPVERGPMYIRALLVPFLVMFVLGLVAFGVAAILEPGLRSTEPALFTVVAAALATTAAGAVSVIAGAPKMGTQLQQILGDYGGIIPLFRQAFPPLLATAAFAPVIAAQIAVKDNKPPMPWVVNTAWVVASIVLLCGAWINSRRDRAT
jgi:hypothetical protein